MDKGVNKVMVDGDKKQTKGIPQHGTYGYMGEVLGSILSAARGGV